MLQVHRFLDQGNAALEKNPQWCDSWSDDIDLGIIPSTFELDDMDLQQGYQAQGLTHPYALDQTVAPELDSLDSQRRQHHSPISGPTGWTANIQGPNGAYGYPQLPAYGQYPRSSPPALSIPDLSRHARSWPGGNTDVDALSTVSPSSPKTPALKFERTEPYILSSWSAPAPPQAHPQAHLWDLKQEPRYPNEVGAGVVVHRFQEDSANPKGESCPPQLEQQRYMQDQFQAPRPPMDPVYSNGQGTVSPSLFRSPMEQAMAEPTEDDHTKLDEDMDAPGDLDSEYLPSQPAPSPSRQSPAFRRDPNSRNSFLAPQNARHRITKPANRKQAVATVPSSTDDFPNVCPTCEHSPSFATLINFQKHILTKHTRPFRCIFHHYQCPQTFGSKNEWARHIRVQHLRLEEWRCDQGRCAPSPASSSRKGGSILHDDTQQQQQHSFDRKDLFTQHLRRMHKELYTKAYLARYNGDKTRMEAPIQDRCHVVVRDAPTGISCPYCKATQQALPYATNSAAPTASKNETSTPTGEVDLVTSPFDSWEEYIEHVANHLEKDAQMTALQAVETTTNNTILEDPKLKQWLLAEGLLLPTHSHRRGSADNDNSAPWPSSLTGRAVVGSWATEKIVGCDGKKSNSGSRNRAVNALAAAAAAAPVRKGSRKTRRRAAAVRHIDDDDDEDADGDYDA